MEESILPFLLPMASALPTLVQTPVHGDNGTGSANVAATWGSATAAGSLLIAVVEYNDSSGIRTIAGPGAWSSALAPTTNGFNSVGIIRDGGSNVAIQIFYLENAASQSGAQTFTLSSSATAIVHLYEVGGMSASLTLDIVKAQSNASSTTWNSGTTGTIFSTDGFAICAWAARNSATYTAASVTNSFVVDDNRITTNVTGNSNVSGVIAHKIGSLTSGGVSSAITVGTARISVGCALVWRNNGAKTGKGISAGVGSGAKSRDVAPKAGTGISEGVGSGASVHTSSGTTYTKAGSGISDGVGSGARARDVAPKAGSGISPGVGSGAKTRDVAPKSGTGISEGAGSGAKTRNVAPKTGSGISDGVGSGAKTRNVAPKTGSGISDGVGSGSRSRDVNPKTGVGISAGVGAGTYVREKTKAGLGATEAVGSGGKIRQATKTGSGISEGVGSGSRARDVAPKTGAGITPGVGSGFYVREKNKTGSGISEGVGSGSRSRDVNPKTGTGFSEGVGAGGKSVERYRTGIGVSQPVGSGTEVRLLDKTGAAISESIGSGASVLFRPVIWTKSGIGISRPIGSGTEIRKMFKFGSGISEAVASGNRALGKTETTSLTGKSRILSKEIYSGDAALPHADPIIFTHGHIRIRVGPGFYV